MGVDKTQKTAAKHRAENNTAQHHHMAAADSVPGSSYSHSHAITTAKKASSFYPSADAGGGDWQLPAMAHLLWHHSEPWGLSRN